MESSVTRVTRSSARDRIDVARMKTTRGVTMAVLLALVATVACGNRALDQSASGGQPAVSGEITNGSLSEPGSKSSSENGGKGRTLVVGGVFHRSGPISSIGLNGCYEGVQAWVAAANARGGINGYRFKFVGYDDGVDPQRAVPLVRRLINEDKIDVFLGHCSDFTADASASETVKAGIPVIGPSVGGSPAWYSNPNWFPVYGDQQWMYPYFAVKAMAAQGVKRAGIIYPGSVPTGLEGYRFTKRYLPESGIDLVYEGSHDILQSDWTAYVSGLKAKGADAVAFTAAAQGIMVAFFKSAKQQGWNGKVFAPWPGYYPGLPKAVGSIDGRFFVTVPHRELESLGAAAEPFKAAMKKYFPSIIYNTMHIQGWMAGDVLEEGLKRLGSTPFTGEALMKSLRTFKDWKGTFGPPLAYVDGPNKEPTVCNSIFEVSGGVFRHSGEPIQCAGVH